VDFEGDAEQAEGLKGVGELQELGFGVDAGAAVGGDEPGVAELGGAVVEIEVEEAGAADDAVRFAERVAVLGLADGDPGQRGAGGLVVERLLHPGAQVLRGADGEDHVAPQDGVEGDLLQRGQVVERHGFQTDAGAFEYGCVHRYRVAQGSVGEKVCRELLIGIRA
jgi:hypothetical protein